jgi:dihydrofolate reductase
MAGYWPTAPDNDAAVRDQMNGTPKLVFSKTLESVEWQNSRLATGSVADEVARLKQMPGDGLLWVCGSDLASSFLEQGLLDEVRIILTSVLLAAGKTVFGDIKKRHPLETLVDEDVQVRETCW